MSVRTTVLTGLAIAGGWLALMLALGGEWETGSSRWPRALEDANDVMAYQKRGAWAASGGRPYLDEFSEYPQLTTWALGLPWLLMDHGIEPGEPAAARRAARARLEEAGVGENAIERLFGALDDAVVRASAGEPRAMAELQGVANATLAGAGVTPAEAQERIEPAFLRANQKSLERERVILETRDTYRAIHQTLQAILLALLIAILARHLDRLGEAPAWALCMALPGSLYFALHRTDLMVACLVALAIATQLAARPRLAALVLGFAIMTKWWPVALVPLFVAQNLARATDLPLAARLRGAVLAPCALLGAVVLGVLSITFLHGGGGLDAVLELPRWHMHERHPNHSSLLALATNPQGLDLAPPAARASLEKVFKVLQFLPGLLLALTFPRGRSLVAGAAAAALGVILFSEFYSPQWVIWVTSIAIVALPGRRLLLGLVVGFELTSYLTFLTFNHAQATTDLGPYRVVTWARLAIMFALLGWLAFLCVREAARERAIAPDGAGS